MFVRTNTICLSTILYLRLRPDDPELDEELRPDDPELEEELRLEELELELRLGVE